MTWRIVVITNRAKLEYKLNSLVVRSENDLVKINLSELSVLIIENTAVSLTTALLVELMSRKIKVIFCDEKRNPSSELIPYYGCHDTSSKIKQQINWKKVDKETVWTKIVESKIRQQSKLLEERGCLLEAEKLLDYINELEIGDVTNREGHSAKVYFNALFGKDFSRKEDNCINAALNYGYSLILSIINREVVASGYLTQLGLFHDNVDNQFNFSCDIMEPFRPVIDRKVLDMAIKDKFETEEKHELVSVLSEYVLVNNNNQTVLNAIKIYCRSVIEALNTSDDSKIKMYGYRK